MAEIFCKSYLNEYKVLPFGYPLTDVYFQNNSNRISFYKMFDIDTRKKLLYMHLPIEKTRMVNK